MSLSQVQIIRSLGDAIAWFERELAWGVSPAELGHLTGRIGELYAAMITRGQMALTVNQHGYDVVAQNGQRISVKTITSSSQVTFRRSTFHHVDRVIVLRVVIDDGDVSIEEVLDCPAEQLVGTTTGTGDHVYRIRANPVAARPLSDIAIVTEATFEEFRIAQHENGTIAVYRGGVPEPVAKPILRDIAARIGVSLLNAKDNAKNTRQLGSAIIAAINAR